MARRLVTILVFLVAGVSLAVVASFAAEPVEGEIAPVAVITAIAEDLSAVKVDEKGQPIGYNVDPIKAKTTRYISLHDYPATERVEITQVIKGHLNGLNRTSSIAPVDKVGPWLLRIDTDDFGDTFARVWEELDTPDPIFHDEDEFGGGIEEVEEEVSVEYGFWVRPDGTKRAGGSKKFDDEKWETTRTEKEKRKVKKLKPGGRRLAPWLTETAAAQKSLEAIQAKVGGTKVPVVTARFFLWQTAIQKNRKPGYCDFLGYKNLKEFEFLGGVVRKDLDAAFKEELRAVTGNSTVTLEQVMRRIVRLGKVDGDYWFTLDANQEEVKNRAKGNPLENLGDDLEFQAIEAYVHLANGMWATGLFNDKGERQDVAPQNIATDSTAPGADRNVHVNLSCIRCHTKGGMQDVNDWVRGGTNLPPNALFGPPGKDGKEDRDASKRLREQYVKRHIAPHLNRSRERYAPALLEATGMTPEKYAGAYAKAWAGVEAPVTAAQAARELGVTTAAYQDALARLGTACDNTLSLHRLPNPLPIPRSLWHQKYNRAQDALRGKARPFKVEVKEERK